MKKLGLLLFLFCFSSSYAQQNTFEKIAIQICDSIKSSSTPKEVMGEEEVMAKLKQVVYLHFEEWSKELIALKVNRGNVDAFGEYFLDILKAHCKEYRKMSLRWDTYVQGKKEERALYEQTHAFIWALTDNFDYPNLRPFLNNSLDTKATIKLLDSAKSEIHQYNNSCKKSIVLVYVDGYTFRVRYSDFKTGETVYQMDVIFSNSNDLRIDKLAVKYKAQLHKEALERKERNRKIQSGELSPPPPPPPPAK